MHDPSSSHLVGSALARLYRTSPLPTLQVHCPLCCSSANRYRESASAKLYLWSAASVRCARHRRKVRRHSCVSSVVPNPWAKAGQRMGSAPACGRPGSHRRASEHILRLQGPEPSEVEGACASAFQGGPSLLQCVPLPMSFMAFRHLLVPFASSGCASRAAVDPLGGRVRSCRAGGRALPRSPEPLRLASAWWADCQLLMRELGRRA